MIKITIEVYDRGMSVLLYTEYQENAGIHDVVVIQQQCLGNQRIF